MQRIMETLEEISLTLKFIREELRNEIKDLNTTLEEIKNQGLPK